MILRAALLAAALALGAGAAQAGNTSGSTRYCDDGTPLTAEHKDRLLRFAGIVKAELERSGARLALVARSGLDLGFFGVRYSHGGISLKGSAETPWAVRQLYFSCDERRPLIFDQGLSAFVLGTHQPELGYVSALLLPPEAEAALERTALDNRRALQLLGGTYSANAHAFSATYQNCNQWLAELLAAAWGADLDGLDGPAARVQAQAWLRDAGYQPMSMDVGWRVLMWAGNLIPWVHSDDHPSEDLEARRFRISMPDAIDAFALAQAPGATRLEFCHNERHALIRRGGPPLAEGCEPGAQDELISLE